MTVKMVRFQLVPTVTLFTKNSWLSKKLSPILEALGDNSPWIGGGGSRSGDMSPLSLEPPSPRVFAPSPLGYSTPLVWHSPESLDLFTSSSPASPVGLEHQDYSSSVEPDTALRIRIPPAKPEIKHDNSPLSPETHRHIKGMRQEELDARLAAIAEAQRNFLVLSSGV
jgi:hypothetical protein